MEKGSSNSSIAFYQSYRPDKIKFMLKSECTLGDNHWDSEKRNITFKRIVGMCDSKSTEYRGRTQGGVVALQKSGV